MEKLLLAALLVAAATPSWAEGGSDANPGTVISNVYEKLPPGTGFGLGAPVYAHYRYVPGQGYVVSGYSRTPEPPRHR